MNDSNINIPKGPRADQLSSLTKLVLRTPDSCFDNLPLWNYEPQYFMSRLYGLDVRMAYYDLGDKRSEETILLTHGMSAWSYLNRRMIPPLLDAGYRVILFDQVGCGRSDKPVREEDYTYERHIGWNIDLLINHLHIKNVTVVLQDWGGLIGTRVVAAHPGAFRRLVISNTMLPTSDDSFFKVSSGFYSWKTFAFRTGLKDDIWIKERGGRWPGQILAQKAVGPSNPNMDPAEMAAYDAPYPDDTYKAGARMFPELVSTPSTDPTNRPAMAEAENNAAAWGVFQKFTKPVLLAFSDEDTVMAGGDAIWKEHCPGTKFPGVEHVTIKGVGHFLQDGGADQLVDAITSLINATPPSSIEPLSAGPAANQAAILAKVAAEAAATDRAVAHGDVGISTPSDGGVSFIAPTPEERKPYQ
ncbi:MAG: haloalkane dehalogenase [Chloroflexi bacterium]|nr:haloalkane dehalogenase [Chloroflexota bacterium]